MTRPDDTPMAPTVPRSEKVTGWLVSVEDEDPDCPDADVQEDIAVAAHVRRLEVVYGVAWLLDRHLRLGDSEGFCPGCDVDLANGEQHFLTCNVAALHRALTALDTDGGGV